MPRQPLSRIRSTLSSSLFVGPETFSARPELAALVCRVITGWAQVEGVLALVFARYAGMSVESALTIYNTVEGFRAQRQMLDGAAKWRLSPDDFHLYSATMSFVMQQYSVRNEMAHWVWARTEDLPNALVIMEPVAHRRQHSMVFGAQTGYDMAKVPKYLQELEENTFVYREPDLKWHADQMFRAEVLADRLQWLAAAPPVYEEQGRNHLLGEPYIVEQYDKLRRGNPIILPTGPPDSSSQTS